jgi:hypothetical protein
MISQRSGLRLMRLPPKHGLQQMLPTHACMRFPLKKRLKSEPKPKPKSPRALRPLKPEHLFLPRQRMFLLRPPRFLRRQLLLYRRFLLSHGTHVNAKSRDFHH